MKLIDVSVPLREDLPTYPGNTPLSPEPMKRIAQGDSSNVSTLHMSAHTGTHVDAPRHFFDAGPGVDQLPLELLIGRTPLREIESRGGSDVEALAGINLADDVRVLFKTRNSKLWASSDFFKDYVGVTE